MGCNAILNFGELDCKNQNESTNDEIKQSFFYLKKNTKKSLKLLIEQYKVIDITYFEEHLCDGRISEINKSIKIKYTDNWNTIFIWTIKNDEFLW